MDLIMVMTWLLTKSERYVPSPSERLLCGCNDSTPAGSNEWEWEAERERCMAWIVYRRLGPCDGRGKNMRGAARSTLAADEQALPGNVLQGHVAWPAGLNSGGELRYFWLERYNTYGTGHCPARRARPSRISRSNWVSCNKSDEICNVKC